MAERTILNSVSGVNLIYAPGTISVSLSVADASVTHTLAIKRNDTTITTITLGSYSVGTRTEYITFTSAQRTAILNAMSDVARFTATYVLTSFNNGSTVGTPSSAEADIWIDGSSIKPVLGNNITYKDTNPATVAMTGDDQYIIIGQSDISFFNVSATAYDGASIAFYRLNENFSGEYIESPTGGTVHFGTVDDVALYDTGIEASLGVQAFDTRGQRSAYLKLDAEHWSYYSSPFFSNSRYPVRNAQDASHIDIYLEGRFQPVGGHNTITATFKYRVTGTDTYSSDVSLPVTINGATFVCNAVGVSGVGSAGFDESSVYDIVVTISDKLKSFSWEYTLPAEVPMLAFRENAVGFGIVPKDTNRIEISPDWTIRGGLELINTPTFTRTSGTSSISMSRYQRWGNVCQLSLGFSLQSANLGDIMLQGTFSGIAMPTTNAFCTIVHTQGSVFTARLTASGTFTLRVGGVNYTAPSGGGTNYATLIYLTDAEVEE